MYVIADDLTGAADAGAPFAGLGPTSLTLDPGLAPRALPGNLAIDLDCREQPGLVAAQRMAAVLARLSRDSGVFVKVDSLLRGPIAEAVSEVSRWAAGPVVVAPALPKAGRCTIEGRLRRHDAARRWGPSLVDMVSGTVPVHLDLHAVRGGGRDLALALRGTDGRPHARVTVLDAETDDDLDSIVRLVHEVAPNAVWVGSSGLAHAIVRAAGPQGNGGDRIPIPGWTRLPQPRCVVAVGSASPIAAAQVQVVADVLGVQPVVLKVNELAMPGGSARARLRRAAEGPHVVVSIDQDDRRGGALDVAVSRAFATAVAEPAKTSDILVLAGGATARAVLERLRLHMLRVCGELAPGVVLLRADGRHIVTKSGSFGVPETLAGAVRQLTERASIA